MRFFFFHMMWKTPEKIAFSMSPIIKCNIKLCVCVCVCFCKYLPNSCLRIYASCIAFYYSIHISWSYITLISPLTFYKNCKNKIIIKWRKGFANPYPVRCVYVNNWIKGKIVEMNCALYAIYMWNILYEYIKIVCIVPLCIFLLTTIFRGFAL